MSRQVQAILSVLVLIAADAATGLAHELSPPPPPPPPFPLTIPGIPGLFPPGTPSLFPPGTPSAPGFPGLLPPGNPEEIAKCWSSLQDVPGCAWEIYTSIFTGKLGVGPACCKAFKAIDDNCLLKMFPLLPFFPPLLKVNCAQGSQH